LFEVSGRAAWIGQLLYVIYILYFYSSNNGNKELKILGILDAVGAERTSSEIECKSKMSAR